MIKLNASRLSLTASVIALTAAFGAPAYGQSTSTPPITPATPPDQPSAPACAKPTGSPNDVCTSGEVETESGQPVTPENTNAIIVTGTRIKRPNLESPVPITSISQQELTSQGQVSVGDALNDLPAIRSTFSQQNSGRFIGTAGQNFLDLRGLGTERTLVLVNGRRMITASPGSFQVDVDNIPQDLIDRIDVVTGGESAVYGSDAVAGVVNFVLKNDFDGWRVRGQGGLSKYGDRPVDFVSTTFGKNFADGRGNLAMNLEYTHAGELFFRDRKHFQRPCGFEPNQDTSNEPQEGDGIPDNIFVCGIRVPYVTNGGSILTGATIFTGQTFGWDPSGNLVVSSVPSQQFVFVNGALLFGDVISDDPLGGSTLNETGDLAVGRDRYSASLLGHFDVSDAFKPFVEGMFVHQVVHQEGQPTFFQNDLHTFFEDGFTTESVPSMSCGNGFLTQQNIDALVADFDCGLDANGNPVGTFTFNRFNVDMGARKEVDTRDTFRVVAGTTGDFNEDWHYELSVNYGHHSADNAQHNDLLIENPDGTPAGFSLAIDAVAVDANGNIVAPGTPGSTVVCRSTLTDPTNGCVPLNLFGEGRADPRAIAFSETTSHLFQSASELDFLGFVSGDTSQWINLPGGPIGFSLGAEHRKETAESHQDPVSAHVGGTFFNALGHFDPPPMKVTEFFGELNVPILKDVRFAHELTVSAAARHSHYNTSAGNTFAWNANAIYAPVSDLRLRGNFSKSVRVPTLTDLFAPQSVDFSFITDPCDQSRITPGSNRETNCALIGVPTTVVSDQSPCFDPVAAPVGSPFHNCTANQFTQQVLDQGNQALQPETGRSLTLGGVFTPRFLPGFSLSVDYFRIKVKNLITALSGTEIVTQCVDQPTIDNQFCSLLFPRDQFGLFQTPALIQQSFNFASQISRGIDFDLSYRHRVGPGRLDFRLFATRTLERTDFASFTDPNFGDRILGEEGDPKWAGTAITGYTLGHFDVRYTLRYIGPQVVSFATWEDLHSFEGRPPQNPDIVDRKSTGTVWYHDIRLGYTVNKYNFYAGVDNVFNKMPPVGGTGTGFFTSIYSNIGRFFYAGAVLDLK